MKIAQMIGNAPPTQKLDHETQNWKVLRALWFFMHKNTPRIKGDQNPKVWFPHENCTMGRKCTTGTKIGPRGTSDLKTEKCSKHYGFLCIRMHQGSQGTKTQKSYIRTKIGQMAENAPTSPKYDHGTQRTSKLKSAPCIMVFYA